MPTKESKDRRRAYLRDYNRVYMRGYRSRNLARVKSQQAAYAKSPSGRRRSYVRNVVRQYGLSEDEYYRMVEESCGRCDSCGRVDDGSKALGLVVDHCHTTGVVRGLVCNQCNVALGMLGDSLSRIAGLYEYVLKRGAGSAAR